MDQLKYPKSVILKIMTTCIILHEQDYNHVHNFKHEQVDDRPPKLTRNHTTKLMNFIQCHHQIRDYLTYY